MATSSLSPEEAPPPTYSEATAFGLKFADFLPLSDADLDDPDDDMDDICFRKNEKRFGDLVKAANEWLRAHKNVSVRICETVTVKRRDFGIQLQRMTWQRNYNNRIHYLRYLRVWYVEQPNPSPDSQQIKYFSVLPHIFGADDIEEYGIAVSSCEVVETFTDILKRMNEMLKRRPVGHILNIEMVLVKLRKHGPDVEDLYWSEAGMEDKGISSSWNFVYCLNVYYLKGVKQSVTIGAVDFCSRHLLSNFDDVELFPTLVERGRQWCNAHQSVRCTNMQTLIGKVKHKRLNSERMHFNNSPTMYSNHSFARFLRLWFVANTDPLLPSIERMQILNYVDFIPKPDPRKNYVSPKKLECLDSVAKRINDWVTETGARIVSCETVKYIFWGASYLEDSVETTYKCGGMSNYWFQVLRVYVDGVYPTDTIHNQPLPPRHILPTEEAEGYDSEDETESCLIT